MLSAAEFVMYPLLGVIFSYGLIRWVLASVFVGLGLVKIFQGRIKKMFLCFGSAFLSVLVLEVILIVLGIILTALTGVEDPTIESISESGIALGLIAAGFFLSMLLHWRPVKKMVLWAWE